MEHQIITENLVKREEGTQGVGVFRIAREPLSAYTSNHIDSFIQNVYPNEFPQKVSGDMESYLTALELSGDMDGYVLLALNCKEAGLLQGESSLLYKVEYQGQPLREPANTLNVIFKSLAQGLGRSTIPINLPADEFICLKVARGLGLLLEITKEELIFYYNTTPYFTNRIPIQIEDKKSLKYIRTQIAKGTYAAEESVVQNAEPKYMGSIKQPHLVFWGVNIGATGEDSTYIFNLGDRRIKVTAALPLTTIFELVNHNTPVLLVIDEEDGLAVYY